MTTNDLNGYLKKWQESELKGLYDPTVTELRQVLQTSIHTRADSEIIDGLKRALHYMDLRDDYCLRCTSQQSALCDQIEEDTLTHPWSDLKEQGKTICNLQPRMLSGKIMGQLLKSLVSMQGARRVLDVGMYTGYSALSMAEALPQDGELVTLDIDPYLLHYNQPVFQASPHGHKISIKIGSAVELMKEMAHEGLTFDFIFIDADKAQYIDYLKICVDEGLLAKNGTIAVDNALRDGLSYLPSDGPPHVSRLFGDYVTQDKSLHKVLVPMRDGLMLIRRQSEVA